jgi:hypothetical protein
MDIPRFVLNSDFNRILYSESNEEIAKGIADLVFAAFEILRTGV